MDKSAIKTFAIWARKKLIEDVRGNANLIGITENGISEPLKQSTEGIQYFDIGANEPYKLLGDDIAKRDKIVKRLQDAADDEDYKTAYTNMLEHTASTWFNRLAAIRFMEVNEYFDDGLLVLSSVNEGSQDSDLMSTPFDSDLEFTDSERQNIIEWKLNNNSESLFELLLQKKCRALGEILPGLFDKANDSTTLLMNFSITDKDGVIFHLTHDIEEDDWKDAVEIIGWLYQYYNTEPKEQVFTNLKKNIKITKDNIPAATQLFTPDWIVRYMVENSLGRLWIEGHPNDAIKAGWKYYLDEAEQEDDVKAELDKIRAEYANLKLEDIKLIDPCMGSGHILVYAFDILMQIYDSQGYTKRDAVQSIIKNNLYGLDVDERAYQLAYFAIMMKARKYDRRFLTRGIEPQVYCPIDYSDGEEYGSLLKVDELGEKLQEPEELTLFNMNWAQKINTWNFRRLINQKYDVVVTNPPYMGSSGMSAKMSEFVKKNYPDSKSDLFAVFIERCLQMAKADAYIAMITQHAFMFLSSYEKLRSKLLHTDFINMAHLGARAFDEIGGEVVQTTSFVMRNRNVNNYKGTYLRLVNYSSQQDKEDAFLARRDTYYALQDNFSKIPGSPIAYWVTNDVVRAFLNSIPAGKIAKFKHGMSTGKNDAVVRLWQEVDFNSIAFGIKNHDELYSTTKRFVPYNKGGEYRKWYGNQTHVLGYDKKYNELMDSFGGHRHDNRDTYFLENISWSKVTSGDLAMRYFSVGFVYDVAGCSAFTSKKYIRYLLAFYNSKVKNVTVSAMSPTLNYEVGQLRNSPIIFKEEKQQTINNIVDQLIELEKADWDSFETSWDFITHPLIEYRNGAGYANVPIDQWHYKIADAFITWKENAEAQFDLIKSNEEELNRIFIDIYGLQDELTPEVDDTDVTARKANLSRDIRSFVSYAVGCMFGRYSLDVDGLAYAGGDWDTNKYKTFEADPDNCIPITDEAYFDDDIVGRFVEFVKVVYGDETLEENLDYIADALGNKGDTSRDVIRSYFLNDFFKDHVRIYQKRPIYWMFDSGKQNGFKALIYMHRWNSDTIATVRASYVTKVQEKYENERRAIDLQLEHLSDKRQSAVQQKRMEKLTRQVTEIKQYDELISHLALEHIDIDLDDGVKVNYEKVQHDNNGDKYKILAPIK